jgi:hypothetical protein
MTTLQLKGLVGMPSGKASAVYSRAIREYMPGGNEVLDIMERLHKAQHGRERKDPMLEDLLAKAARARDKMVDAIKAEIDGVVVDLYRPPAGEGETS